jgi:hypothetical protein
MQIELTDSEVFNLRVVISSISNLSSLLVVSMQSGASSVQIELTANNVRDLCMMIDPIISRLDS